MSIKSAQYVQDVDGNNYAINIVVGDKTICVPPDPANRHYAEILEWVAEGNTIEEAE